MRLLSADKVPARRMPVAPRFEARARLDARHRGERATDLTATLGWLRSTNR